jgi:hypothetical protein
MGLLRSDYIIRSKVRTDASEAHERLRHKRTVATQAIYSVSFLALSHRPWVGALII